MDSTPQEAYHPDGFASNASCGDEARHVVGEADGVFQSCAGGDARVCRAAVSRARVAVAEWLSRPNVLQGVGLKYLALLSPP